VATGESGGVFISYRRQDTIHFAGRLYDRLADRLGDDQVFMDVARIGPGIDFAEAITQAVSACQVLLAVIGPAWLTATDEQGRRRLDDPKDFVRLEIQAALDRDIRVIPILVSGANMPRADQLPRRLAKLARRNAITMHDDSIPEDAERLLTKIEPLLEVTMAAAPGSPLAHGMLGRPLRQVVATPSTLSVFRHPREVRVVAFSPDGLLLATVSDDWVVRLWDVTSAQVRAQISQDVPVGDLAFSPDGRLLATASYDTRLWEVASGRERPRAGLHATEARGVAFSPDGRLLATADREGARLWEVASGRERVRLKHDRAVMGVAFSPDGLLLATISDRSGRIWEVPSGRERVRVIHDDWVQGMAFSPDGRLLATASQDLTARLWEVASGREHVRVTHDNLVQGVAFSPDGRLLATASADQTARLWEVASGRECARVTHAQPGGLIVGPVYGVTVSPDGRLLATASRDRTARLWTLYQ
jgi:WD40 repeat protein